MAEIRTKAEMFRLWNAGALGNKLQTWKPGEQLPPGPPVGIRYADPRGGGGRCDYDVPRREVPARLEEWRAAGLNPEYAVICETAPDHRATLQGEIRDTEHIGLRGFLELHSKMRMRTAINAGKLKPYGPLATRMLMRQYMDEPSREHVEALLETYPDATIEFTCYDFKIGHLSQNTIIWEVRNY